MKLTSRALRLAAHVIAAIGLIVGITIIPISSVDATGLTQVAPTTIDGTGRSDATSALVSFLRQVPDGSTVSFPAGARYRIEGVIVLQDRHDLTIDGTGATFVVTTDGSTATEGPDHEWWGRNWPRKRGQFVFHGGSGLTIRNLTIVGPNAGAGATNAAYVAALEAQHGVEFFGTSDSVLEGCSIRNTYGDLVSVSGESRNIVVRNCMLTHSGRQGVTVDRARQVRIENNHIGDIGRSAIDLEPARADWTVDGVRIAGNRIGRANGVFIAAYGSGPVDNVAVHGNTLTGEEINILVKDSKGLARRNWTVTNNTSDTIVGSPVAPIRFTKVDNITISGNLQPIASTQGRLAVAITGATTVRVADNAFPIINTRDQTRPATGETAGLLVNGLAHSQPVTMGTPTDSLREQSGEVADRFVRRVFSDFVQRAPTAEELSTWKTTVTGSTGRTQLARRLAYSDEWIGALVDRFYRDTLDRVADAPGKRHWIDVIRRGAMTPAQVAASFYASPEYFANKGEGSHVQWVEQLYLTLLRRSPDAAGREHWIAIARTQGRQAVTRPFYDSPETLRTRVDSLYQVLLGRPADAGGLVHWSATVRATGSDVELAVQLASSTEYFTRPTG